MIAETKTQIENIDTFQARLLKAEMLSTDFILVMRAYKLSKSAHRNQTRKNGVRRYFEHCRDLALMLMDELNCYNANLLCSALLHDTGEDTGMWGNITKGYEQWEEEARVDLRNCFNFHIAESVIKLTKGTVDNIDFHSKQEVTNHYIKGFTQIRTDWMPIELVRIDAILLKMVDRLCNLREMDDATDAHIIKQIIETEEVYYPIFQSILDDESVGKMAVYLFEQIQQRIEQLKQEVKKTIGVFYFKYNVYDERGREPKIENKTFYYLDAEDAKNKHSDLLQSLNKETTKISDLKYKLLSQREKTQLFGERTSIIKE